jgi:hypothetical protein
MNNKSINLTKILLLLTTAWLTQYQVNAQGQGYPWMDGYYNTANAATYAVTFDANKTLNEGDLFYADQDRAEIVYCYRTNANQPYKIMITNNISHRHGRFKFFNGVDSMKNEVRRFFLFQTRLATPLDASGFYDPNGNWVMGECCEVILLNCRDSSGFTIAEVSNGGNMGFLNKTYSNEVMQIVRVPIFRNFALQGGVATCHEYDGHTGGYLPLRAENLICKSGFFSAAAKGYYPENMTWGTPSNGTAGDAVYSSAAPVSQYRDYRSICPNTTGITLNNGNFGTVGDPPVVNSINGTLSSGYQYKYGLPHTSPFLRPKMGEAGYFKTAASHKAGKGGEGGGHGGTGGSSSTPMPGLNGQPGTAAGNGGTVGKGARGGGVILLRIENMAYASGHIFNLPGKKLFYINGQNGQNGGNGGAGGNGGLGGDGGPGNVLGTTVNRPGGYGGPGQAGLGGTGGDGSNGGSPGTLGLHLKNFYPNPSGLTSYAHFLSVTNFGAGIRGYGGQGGFKGTSRGISTTNEFYTLPAGKSWCTPGGGTSPISEICDCDSVFWALSSSTGNNNGISSTKHQHDMNNYIITVEYDTGEVHLTSLYKGGRVRSHCILYNDTQCVPMFEKMRTFQPLPSSWGDINLTLRQGQRISSSPLIVEFQKSATPFTKALTWNGLDGVLYDEMEPGRPICYKASCDQKNPDNRLPEVPKGEDNSPGQTPVTTESVDEKNVGFFEQWPEVLVWQDPKSKPGMKGWSNISDAVIIKDEHNLTINVPVAVYRNNVQFTLVNALGQTLQTGTMEYKSTKKIPVDGLSSGVYTLLLSSESGSFVYKFIIY